MQGLFRRSHNRNSRFLLKLPSRKLHIFCLLTGLAEADRYANNQNSVDVDSPPAAADFPNVDSISLPSPAFLSPQSVPQTFANGTSGPAPQDELETFVRNVAGRRGWISLRVDTLSEEGRAIPYVTISNGKKKDGKLRFWIQRGQHGDEPAGDQGLLALLGKFSVDAQWATKVLDKIDFVILPRYNVDGVKYFQRALASNCDPNRDHAVLERQQTQDIRTRQSAFDPHVFVDAHEYPSGGTIAQQYIRAQDLLVSANKNPNINQKIRALNEEFVDEIFAASKAKGLRTGPYFTTTVTNGTIMIREPDWHAQANHKEAGNYQSLTLLVETRGIRLANQHFQRRVASHVITLETIINKTVNEFDKVYNTLEAGPTAFIDSKEDIVVKDYYRVTNKSIGFLNAANGSLTNMTVHSQNSDPSIILVSRSRPQAYIFSRAWTDVALRLRVLGVKVDELKEDFAGTVEALVIQNATLAKTKFEGIAGTSVTTNSTRRNVKIPKGGFRVDTRQKNAGYAFVLLEPEGIASLAYYNKIPV